MGCPKCKSPIFTTMGFEDLSIRGKSGRWEILHCTACGETWLQEQTKYRKEEKRNGRLHHQTSLVR